MKRQGAQIKEITGARALIQNNYADDDDSDNDCDDDDDDTTQASFGERDPESPETSCKESQEKETNDSPSSLETPPQEFGPE